MTAVDKAIKEYEKYAKKNGFKLNPNKNIVKGVIKVLLENEKKFGKRYCPCQRKKVCPCFCHLKDIKLNGYCYCRLFAANN